MAQALLWHISSGISHQKAPCEHIKRL